MSERAGIDFLIEPTPGNGPVCVIKLRGVGGQSTADGYAGKYAGRVGAGVSLTVRQAG